MQISRIIFSVVIAHAVATVFCLAQTYTIVPSRSIIKFGKLEDTETLSIQQVNKTNHPINLAWRKLHSIIPNGWEANVCDNSHCNDSLVISGEMTPVLVGEYGLLLIHITPHISNGTAYVRYLVWDTTEPAITDTLSYQLQVEQKSEENEKNNQLKLFPIPAHSSLTVTFPDFSTASYKIFDVNGNQVIIAEEESSNDNHIINIDNLVSGVYLFVYSVGTNSISKTFIVKK